MALWSIKHGRFGTFDPLWKHDALFVAKLYVVPDETDGNELRMG